MGNETLYKIKKSPDSDAIQLEEVAEINTETGKVKMSVSNKVLLVSFIAVITFTIASFILQFVTGTEVPAVLTEYWFKFFQTEVFVLSGIKISKVFKAHNGIVTDENTEGDGEE